MPLPTVRPVLLLLLAAACSVLFASSSTGGAAPSIEAEPAFRDPAQPFEHRIQDLINQLTLDEKAGLMKNASDGVPRLGIPPYEWWNEGLHGVARAGVATVFPQAIGLAAMWDEAVMHQVGAVISTEARAKHAEALAAGRPGSRYRGLTLWSPNINIFRDPRWGRGQETYGEDPFLTGRLGAAFVRGLQGDDSSYLKTAACAKHLAVHSGPEPTRYQVNVEPSLADLYETYLPAFEMLVRSARVEAVMTAYNALYGTPCSMHPLLYDRLCRWGFDGHVVSDCGAVYCLYEKYAVAADFPEAEALAVKAGLSLRCGSGEAQLAIAVRRGLLTEAELDAGLAPLLRTWFRLGFFDPPARVPYSQIGIHDVDTPEHAALALEATRRSLVLLKNDGTLPLEPGALRRVLVVGPNAASVPALLGNYHGTPSKPVTVLDGLRAALEPSISVDYVRGSDYAESRSHVGVVPRTALTSICDCDEPDEGDTSGLITEFFANPQLAGEPVARQRHHQIEFAWNGEPPAPDVPATDFSARWTGTLTPPLTGDYQFTLSARGGVRLFLDDDPVLDAWSIPDDLVTHHVSYPLASDTAVSVRLEYRHGPRAGPAAISLQWNPPPADVEFAAALERAREADVVVFVGGISAQLEGEDMRVDYEGFFGGDRTHIELPAIQQRLIEALAATGRPLVFVNLSGSAVAWPELESKVGAIVQAWYPGQAGGSALADVLLGRSNPSGRLPVTFYRTTKDLPDFEDYDMAGRTYRYFHGDVLYPFGHGLSYTSFVYSDLNVTRSASGALEASIDVTNTGKRPGEEVVQLYLVDPASTPPRAIRSLAGFGRVSLAAGATATVQITIPATSLRRWSDAAGDYHVPPGEWQVLAGASSADIRQQATIVIE